jgi:hypothetical protein
MTLGIVSFCPLNRKLPTAGISLVADTRLTIKANNGKLYSFDRGRKIFKLGEYSGYIYSGSSNAALVPLSGLRNFFKQNEKPPAGQITEGLLATILSQGLKRTRIDNPDSWYQGIVVFANAGGSYTRVIYNPFVAYGQGFWTYIDGDLSPESMGSWFIGSGTQYLEHLDNKLADGLKQIPDLYDSDIPLRHSTYLMWALSEFALKDKLDPYVGGGVQGAFISHSNGFEFLSLGKREDGDEAFEMLTPKHLTALP